ncbi:MAG TPA: nitroreductase family protein [Blastocatellia bacterium]|nr:nitroreductase family protein [Blastocatellia bacterium]
MSTQSADRGSIERTLTAMRLLLELEPFRLAAFTETLAGHKPEPAAWSRKQELGHLIDSAANNHQRIVRAQIESGLALPGYDGDRWVEIHRYQERNWVDLIDMWRELNHQLLRAAESVAEPAWSNTLTIGDSQEMTLGYVFVDYLRHMADHLRHIGASIDDLVDGTNSAGPYPDKPAPVVAPIDGLISHRWSPRAFEEGRQVEREKIISMLEAARWAPSCFNDQPRYFVVFDGTDPAALTAARGCISPGNEWALKAPVLILSVAREYFEKNGKPNRWGQHDTGLATENLFLQAVKLGLAAHAMGGFDAEQAKTAFSIPDGHTPMAMIAVGYPYRGNLEELDDKTRKMELSERQRKRLEDMAFDGRFKS